MHKSHEEIIDIMASNFDMPKMIKLKRPKKGKKALNFSLTNKMIFHEMIFQTILDKLSLFYDDPTLYITGAHDKLGHSTNSLHYTGLALDFRTWNFCDKFLHAKYDTVEWQYALAGAWISVANALPDYFFIIHFNNKRPHIHFQYGKKNIRRKKGTNCQGINKNLIIKPENNKITV